MLKLGHDNQGWPFTRSRVVQFSHFSVKEVLMVDLLAGPIRDVSSYYIRLKAAYMVLAQVMP
jgi:hypothetical protein